jgi:hypothetical protein
MKKQSQAVSNDNLVLMEQDHKKAHNQHTIPTFSFSIAPQQQQQHRVV